MGEMRTLSGAGDVRQMWDPAVPAEVEAARRVFNDLTGKGHLAFKVTEGKGKKGEQIRTFDPAAGKIIPGATDAGWLMPNYAGTNGNIYINSNATIWKSWTYDVTTTSTTVDVWRQWNQTTSTTTNVYIGDTDWVFQPATLVDWQLPPARPAPTAAEVRLQAARARDAERARKTREREAAIAQRKARRLLLAHLTPEQRDEFERLERFHVVAADGRTYRVNRGISGNLQLVEDEFITEQLCVHPGVAVPAEDNMLIQKLMLETVPDELRRIANITRLRRAA